MTMHALATAFLLAVAPTRPLTFDDLYHPLQKLDFSAPPAPVWVSDTHFLWPRAEGDDAFTVMRVEALSGRAEPLFDLARAEAGLVEAGADPKEARTAARRKSYAMGDAADALLLEAGGDLYHLHLGTHAVRRLTRTAGTEEQAALSPDGRRVAFVRDHDLYVVETAGGRERRLTTDGSENVLNGKLDWVYQEEVYGRGKFRAFWWSPDGARLAFLRLDETRVPRYTLVDELPYRPALQTYPYPKAGDPNPVARLGVADAARGGLAWMDLLAPAADEPLVVDVSWTPDSRRVAFQVQNREQTWLDLNLADAATGRSRRVLRETTRAWVEPHGSPRWLADGSFLWLSERTGWKHLYHHAADGSLRRALTSGEWEVRELHGVDQRAGAAYLSTTERGPRGLDVYCLTLADGARTLLTPDRGTHAPHFAPSFALWTDTWSTVAQPPVVRLVQADGTVARVVDERAAERLRGFRFLAPEALQVPTRDGGVMEAWLFKPEDFDPSRRYPVIQYTYAGPHAPRAIDKWDAEHLFHQLVLQKGVVVWVCDNRTASGKGAVSTWPIYQRAGEPELSDIEDGVAWLRRQPWVDAARIGIRGHSYGGFMAAYALTHGTSFAMGIAGSPVTDWRDYDSIYTERIMRLPAHNPDGYRRTSPALAAAALHGKLLLYHGLMDDNVHPQNATQLAHALQQAGKPFRLMTYARTLHAFTDPGVVRHWRALMLDFVAETLGGAP
jgi:dipeptidyl-peptidase-4